MAICTSEILARELSVAIKLSSWPMNDVSVGVGSDSISSMTIEELSFGS